MKFLNILACIWLVFVLGCVKDGDLASSFLSYGEFSINDLPLSGLVKVEGNVASQELLTSIHLKNETEKRINIREIKVETDDGLQARSIAPSINFTLLPQADTSALISFIPINDYQLYLLTNKYGAFLQRYNVLIYYQAEGENESNIRLTFSAQDLEYAAYLDQFKSMVIPYTLEVNKKFEKEQEAYLQEHLNGSVFTHLSKQEVAIAGLNFRLQNFWESDTLYTKITAVNHADFPIQMVPDSLDIGWEGNQPNDGKKEVRSWKITGSEVEKNTLRKGDRVRIELKKYSKSHDKEELMISLKKVFLLPDGSSLFYKDLKLAELQF